MTDQQDKEERLGETMRDLRYDENPPPRCEHCDRLLIREEIVGSRDFEWACVNCD